MNRFIFILAFLFLSKCGFSQDFTDTRRKTESFVRLQPAEIRADVAFFAFKGISESAQAPKLQKIDPTSIGRDSIVFNSGNIYAKVKLAPFDPKAHKLLYDEKTLTRIDRKTYYGNYGSVPRTSIASIIVIIDGDTIPIPSVAYEDLHNMNFVYIDKGVERTRDGIYISKDGKKVYLYLFSKDNTGSYEVTYIFYDNKYFRRVLDYGFL